MASNKKKAPNKRQLRNVRIQQIIFAAIGILIILSMVIGMIVNF